MSKKMWTDEDRKFLVDNIDILSKEYICEALDRSINSINRMIRRMGLIEKVHTEWSEYELDILHENYAFEKIEDFMHLLPNRSKNAIMLKANDIGLIKEKRNSDNMKKYIVDVDYFKHIDTPNKAYYLGWAMTDGNVSIQNKSYQYRIRLNKKDTDILVKFLKEIDGNTPIYKRGNCVEVNICSNDFVNHLINLGCIPNKTFDVEYPVISKEFDLDFIKGCFDGDGSYVCTEKTKKITLVSSSESFVNSISTKLNEYGIKSNIHNYSTYFSLTIGRKKCIKDFIELMLATNSDFMDRKQCKMYELLNCVK